MKSSADVVIIGAGVIGCSTAYHLAAAGITDVAVVEMGQVGSGSTSKSAAMLSMQFCSDELSARLAQLSYARYMRFEDEIGVPIDFHRSGWLSVATAELAAELVEGAAMLNGLGITTEVLDAAEITRRCPEIYADDLALGAFGPDDGPFDPHMIVWGYARQASAQGVRLHQGVAATGVRLAGGRVVGVDTTAGFIAAPVVVNAAGPWAAEVGGWTGLDIPIVNRSRTILVTGPFPAIPSDRPFVEDMDAGWYYRPEGDGVLMGMGLEPVDDPANSPTSPVLVDRMIDAAVHRVPALEHASILTTWTGVRPLTPDGLPILGPAPSVDGLVLSCGWGGVGIIMAPLAGLLAAEIVAKGRGETFDCRPFTPGRFA